MEMFDTDDRNGPSFLGFLNVTDMSGAWREYGRVESARFSPAICHRIHS